MIMSSKVHFQLDCHHQLLRKLKRKMNLIWVLLIFGAFLSITDGVKLRPKPNWKPLYHRKTAISRWGRFHSMSGVDHDKGHQKMYPKKFGPRLGKGKNRRKIFR